MSSGEARDAAAEAAHRLADFAEIAAEWFWEMDASLRFSFASDRLEATTGVPVATIVGRTIGRLPQLGSDTDLRAILVRRESFEDIDFTWTAPDGGVSSLIASGRPRHDAAGAFAGYRGIGRDVTAERRAVRDAREAGTKLRTLVDALPVCIAYVDHDMRYGLNNETYRRWFAGSSESLRGRTLASVLGRKAWAEAALPVRCALQGEPISFGQSIDAGDGAVRELQTALVPHEGPDGEVLGAFVLSHDIGEQKRRGDRLAEYLRYLSAALDGLDAALVVLDSAACIRLDNATWRTMAAELTGVPAATHPRYADVCAALPVRASETNRDMVKAVEAFARDGGPPVRMDVACPGPDCERWLRITTSEFREGTERYVLVAHEDITQGVRMVQRLRARDTALARSARLSSLGELAATVAHELNQPLTAIGNYANLAASLAADPKGDTAPLLDTLERLVAEARRSGDIVRRLNRSVRRLPAPRASVQPQRLVSDVLARLVTRADEAGAELHAEIAPDVPSIEADRIQLEQVLDNTVANAIDALAGAGRTGSVHVVVRRDPSRPRLVFDVVDDGPGFPDALDGDPFEPFVTGRAEGLGLGLAICRSIVESHGGGIEFGASEQGGARVSFTLPLEEAP